MTLHVILDLARGAPEPTASRKEKENMAAFGILVASAAIWAACIAYERYSDAQE